MPKDVVVESEDFGGLSFIGAAETALELADMLRPVADHQLGCPNWFSDFVFALEVACQDAGLLDENFARVG
jgi:hypothetical protein